VAWNGRELRRVDAGTADTVVMVGPSPIGAFCRLNGDLLSTGDRIAPVNAAMLRLLDAELGTGFGPVEVAPDVRG
jgi:hypothetical protein